MDHDTEDAFNDSGGCDGVRFDVKEIISHQLIKKVWSISSCHADSEDIEWLLNL